MQTNRYDYEEEKSEEVRRVEPDDISEPEVVKVKKTKSQKKEVNDSGSDPEKGEIEESEPCPKTDPEIRDFVRSLHQKQVDLFDEAIFKYDLEKKEIVRKSQDDIFDNLSDSSDEENSKGRQTARPFGVAML